MKCGVWRVQFEVWGVKSAVWSVKFGVWRKQWEVRSVKCGLWSVQCGLWSVKFGVRRVHCEVWTVKWAVWSVKCGVLRVQCEVKCWLRRVQCEECSVKCEDCQVWSVTWSFKCDMWNKTPVSQSARTHGLRWRTAHASSIDEKGLIYIFKATSAPPRAGTTGKEPAAYFKFASSLPLLLIMASYPGSTSKTSWTTGTFVPPSKPTKIAWRVSIHFVRSCFLSSMGCILWRHFQDHWSHFRNHQLLQHSMIGPAPAKLARTSSNFWGLSVPKRGCY